MKKIFNHATILTVATLFTLTACLSDNPYSPPDNGEGTTISLRFNPAEFETRGTGSPNPSALTIDTGNLYLVASNGTIVEHFFIANVPAHNLPQGIISRNLLMSGAPVTIAGVPVSLRYGRVYLVANTPGLPTTGNISAVLNSPALDIRFQRSGGTTPPHLFDSASLELRSIPVTPETWGAELSLSPAVARIQIAAFAGLGKIEGFTIEGVFIDNYYRRAYVDGRPVDGTTSTPTSLRRNIVDGREFYNNTSGFPTAFHTITFDWLNVSSANDDIDIIRPDGALYTITDVPVARLSGDNVWSYYVFAGTGTRKPHIVLRLSNVQVTGEAQPRPTQFVVFNNFTWQNIYGVPDHPSGTMGISAGNRYIVFNTVFSEVDLMSTIPTTLSTLSTRAIPITIE